MQVIRLANSKKDRQHWLECRKELVTASDVGAMLDLGMYKKRRGLLREKITGIEDFQGSIYSRCGSALEDAILEWAVEEFPDWLSAGRFQDLLQDPECERLGATPDALVVAEGGEIINCQVKCSAKLAKTLDEGLPDDWRLQMQVEMACLGPWCRKSVLLAFLRREGPWSGDDALLRRYVVHRDDDLIDRIRLGAVGFWKQVEAGRRSHEG